MPWLALCLVRAPGAMAVMHPLRLPPDGVVILTLPAPRLKTGVA
ncbi:hypothetical protein [Actinokineospora xionganensis]|nr:hypothetical protein [Actinokineospora xionganensis]